MKGRGGRIVPRREGPSNRANRRTCHRQPLCDAVTGSGRPRLADGPVQRSATGRPESSATYSVIWSCTFFAVRRRGVEVLQRLGQRIDRRIVEDRLVDELLRFEVAVRIFHEVGRLGDDFRPLDIVDEGEGGVGIGRILRHDHQIHPEQRALLRDRIVHVDARLGAVLGLDDVAGIAEDEAGLAGGERIDQRGSNLRTKGRIFISRSAAFCMSSRLFELGSRPR